MKEMVLGGLAVVGVGLATFYAPPFRFGTMERVDPAHGPIYGLSTDDAVAQLMAAKPAAGSRPFGDVEIVTRKVGDDTVEFRAAGEKSRFSCTATAFDARSDAVQFRTACAEVAEQKSDFAMPVIDEMRSIEFRELVDSTMQKRPYNFEKVQQQTAAAMLKQMPKMQQQIGDQMTKIATEMDQHVEEAEDRAWLEGEVDTSE